MLYERENILQHSLLRGEVNKAMTGVALWDGVKVFVKHELLEKHLNI